MALENLGATAEQSLAGATATGTHGTGRRTGSMSTQIVALRMVLANGTIVSVDAVTQPRLFAAARVSLGSLGVVTSLTLRVVDLFRMRLDTIPMDLDTMLTQLPQLMVRGKEEKEYWGGLCLSLSFYVFLLSHYAFLSVSLSFSMYLFVFLCLSMSLYAALCLS